VTTLALAIAAPAIAQEKEKKNWLVIGQEPKADQHDSISGRHGHALQTFGLTPRGKWDLLLPPTDCKNIHQEPQMGPRKTFDACRRHRVLQPTGDLWNDGLFQEAEPLLPFTR